MKLVVHGISGNAVTITVSEGTMTNICNAVGKALRTSPFNVILIQGNRVISGDTPLNIRQSIFYYLLEPKPTQPAQDKMPCDKICSMLSTMRRPSASDKQFYAEYAEIASRKPPHYNDRIRRLAQMGYDAENIEEAMRYSDYNVENAAALLADEEEKNNVEQAFFTGRRYYRGFGGMLGALHRRERVGDYEERLRLRMEQRQQERHRIRTGRPEQQENDENPVLHRLADVLGHGNPFGINLGMEEQTEEERLRERIHRTERMLHALTDEPNEHQEDIARLLEQIDHLHEHLRRIRQ